MKIYCNNTLRTFKLQEEESIIQKNTVRNNIKNNSCHNDAV